MTLRVVHLVTSFDTGGLQNGIVNLINHSDPRRVEHTVLSMWPETGLASRLCRGDVRSLGFTRGRVPHAWRQVARSLNELRPHVLHTRNWGTYPDGIRAARSAGVKACIHGFHGRDIHNAGGEILRRRILGRLLAFRTTRIVTLTPTMKREYMRDFRVPARMIEVIPNGIDLGRVAEFEADEAVRSTFTVAAVGRLDPVKNFGMLIRAFHRCRSRAPTDRLVIAGDGPERERLEALVSDLEMNSAVKFLGLRKDVPAVLKGADLFVQPSIYEGMSNTLVEAMACGIPVVATDVGGNADVVGRDGEAVLVPSDDAEALQGVLERLRSDPVELRRLGEAGRDRVRERFGLERMVDRYTALYESVAESALGRPVMGGR